MISRRGLKIRLFQNQTKPRLDILFSVQRVDWYVKAINAEWKTRAQPPTPFSSLFLFGYTIPIHFSLHCMRPPRKY